ncbi:aryl hydrocarbon receptor nuclear translocator-like protein 1 isoform X2 [Aricia agestis]|uniref:aryl hydrocarbon receptor nuclear translocator-like protein 1 isoform X2 n=1 Tax=Aricia agestis TaxID=91739 RepID=UPI001C20736A|nr:aryl hydrocarbon receptor nuclear translocator-like protein 1 isoform X2 [Aricia agestis]
MDDWWLLEREYNAYDYPYPCYPDKEVQPVPAQFDPQFNPAPALTLLLSPNQPENAPKCDNPREIRNRAEKQRRDKLNQSISKLASMVPPVVRPGRKIDKTSVLRLTAHYLRSHQYVFGDSFDPSTQFTTGFTKTLLRMLKGFLITTTYKGIIVVVSPNIQEYLGYTELELLGQNIFNIVHEGDHMLLREQLLPMTCMLGNNGELLLPEGPDAQKRVADLLANDKRAFIIRFKKLTQQRSEPPQYVTCHVEGSLRKSDRACTRNSRYCHIVRRVRSRGENHCPSGNDVVFIGLVRPTVESFFSESALESFRMEYRTRHSVDGEIIQCEQRIALVTGYMTHEVNGVNAMNFMHRDDVRWVIIALRQMYDQNRLVGESCYRLMTKNGQFIYMRTCGQLDVDQASKAVTSFVCTNTVVDEAEGKRLIKNMKKKFTLMMNNSEDTGSDEEIKEEQSDGAPAIEDPRQLQKVILHLVTDLSTPQPTDDSQSLCRLAIIPPGRDRIVCAIKKSYSVIKNLPDPSKMEKDEKTRDAGQGPSKSPGPGPAYQLMETDSDIDDTSSSLSDPQFTGLSRRRKTRPQNLQLGKYKLLSTNKKDKKPKVKKPGTPRPTDLKRDSTTILKDKLSAFRLQAVHEGPSTYKVDDSNSRLMIAGKRSSDELSDDETKAQELLLDFDESSMDSRSSRALHDRSKTT